MSESISAETIMILLKSNGNQSRSLAENFIDSIVRPYNLSDARVVALFENVKRPIKVLSNCPK